MRNIKIYFAYISLFFPVFAENHMSVWEELASKSEKYLKHKDVYLDNAVIQSYNGHIGIWRYIHNSNTIKNYILKYSISLDDIRKANHQNSHSQMVGWLFIPYSKETQQEYHKSGIIRQKLSLSDAEFVWPTLGSRITSRVGNRWGSHHSGIDIAVEEGTPVLAAQDGIVINKFYNKGGYGISITIDHPDGYITKYAHLSAALVHKGDKIKKGQIIALSGNSGRSTGPHLHFEVQCGKMILNPEYFLSKFEESMQATVEFKTDIHNKLNNLN